MTFETLHLSHLVRETLARITPDVRDRAHSRADSIVETLGANDDDFTARYHALSSLDRAGFVLALRSFLKAVEVIEHPKPEPEHWLIRDARTLLLHYGDKPIEQCITDAFINALRGAVWAKQLEELPELIVAHETAMKIVHQRREEKLLGARTPARSIAAPNPAERPRTLREKPAPIQTLVMPPKGASTALPTRPITRLTLPGRGAATQSNSAAA